MYQQILRHFPPTFTHPPRIYVSPSLMYYDARRLLSLSQASPPLYLLPLYLLLTLFLSLAGFFVSQRWGRQSKEEHLDGPIFITYTAIDRLLDLFFFFLSSLPNGIRGGGDSWIYRLFIEIGRWALPPTLACRTSKEMADTLRKEGNK